MQTTRGLKVVSRAYAVNGISLNSIIGGEDCKGTILFLHGFPGFSGSWKTILPAFLDDYFCIAPDLRGFNLSSKPLGVSAYGIEHSTQDVIELIGKAASGNAVFLVGHDIGGYLAYSAAIARPDLVNALIVINGPHPTAFQWALWTDAGQRDASRYLDRLRAPGAEDFLSANGYAALIETYRASLNGADIDPDTLRAHLAAWSQKGALEAMVNWYRANVFDVPDPALGLRAFDPGPIETADQRIKVPHLVIWGDQDPYLKPACHTSLEPFCSALTKCILPDAGHAPVATHGPAVTNAMTAFLNAPKVALAQEI